MDSFSSIQICPCAKLDKHTDATDFIPSTADVGGNEIAHWTEGNFFIMLNGITLDALSRAQVK